MIWGMTCCILHRLHIFVAWIFTIPCMKHVAIPISFPQLQVPFSVMVSPVTVGRFPMSSATAPLWATLPLDRTVWPMTSPGFPPERWQKRTGKGALRCVPVASKSGYMQMRHHWVLEVVATKKVTLSVSRCCNFWWKMWPKIHFCLVPWIFLGGNFPLLGPPPLTSKIQDWSSNPALLKPSQKYPDVACKASRPCYTTYTPVN